MKLSELKQKLISTLPKNMMPIGINVDNLEQGGILPYSSQTPFNIDSVKVIGVVGSRGKTTTCFIIHEFLKASGKKSMLYSSAKIDSPAGFSNPEEGAETPLRSETILLQLLLEAESYQPEFIVLEVNESAITKGFVKDIPFTARVLTNIFSNHHLDIEPEDQYVNTIKSFFKDVNPSESARSINIFGLTGNLTREGLNELLNLNLSKSYLFGSKHIAEVRNTNSASFDSLLLNCLHDIKGMEIEVSLKHEIYKFNTKMIMPYNALNITCALTVLQALLKPFKKLYLIYRFPEEKRSLLFKTLK
ncbi:MAG: Mur ligase family protein [Erysipelotrichales bacterium]|nr:Mur ligase family protein [Erysipelotrichales bacterium]